MDFKRLFVFLAVGLLFGGGLASAGIASNGVSSAGAVSSGIASVASSDAASVKKPVPSGVSCKKTVEGTCTRISCEDGFEMKFCDNRVVCKEYVNEKGCVVRECSDGTSTVTCPTCKEYVDGNGCTVRECSDGTISVSCPDDRVKETVTCVFTNAKEAQKCYSENGGCTAYPLKCAGSEKCLTPRYISCDAKVAGKKGQGLSWKSTCGGYGTTTLDGMDEKVSFACGKVLEAGAGNSLLPPETKLA